MDSPTLWVFVGKVAKEEREEHASSAGPRAIQREVRVVKEMMESDFSLAIAVGAASQAIEQTIANTRRLILSGEDGHGTRNRLFVLKFSWGLRASNVSNPYFAGFNAPGKPQPRVSAQDVIARPVGHVIPMVGSRGGSHREAPMADFMAMEWRRVPNARKFMFQRGGCADC